MCALVTGVQTCALPICGREGVDSAGSRRSGDADRLAPPARGQGDLVLRARQILHRPDLVVLPLLAARLFVRALRHGPQELRPAARRSEEHTSELQSLMRISYAVFCLKKKNNKRLHKYSV